MRWTIRLGRISARHRLPFQAAWAVVVAAAAAGAAAAQEEEVEQEQEQEEQEEQELPVVRYFPHPPHERAQAHASGSAASRLGACLTASAPLWTTKWSSAACWSSEARACWPR